MRRVSSSSVPMLSTSVSQSLPQRVLEKTPPRTQTPPTPLPAYSVASPCQSESDAPTVDSHRSSTVFSSPLVSSPPVASPSISPPAVDSVVGDRERKSGPPPPNVNFIRVPSGVFLTASISSNRSGKAQQPRPAPPPPSGPSSSPPPRVTFTSTPTHRNRTRAATTSTPTRGSVTASSLITPSANNLEAKLSYTSGYSYARSGGSGNANGNGRHRSRSGSAECLGGLREQSGLAVTASTSIPGSGSISPPQGPPRRSQVSSKAGPSARAGTRTRSRTSSSASSSSSSSATTGNNFEAVRRELAFTPFNAPPPLLAAVGGPPSTGASAASTSIAAGPSSPSNSRPNSTPSSPGPFLTRRSLSSPHLQLMHLDPYSGINANPNPNPIATSYPNINPNPNPNPNPFALGSLGLGLGLGSPPPYTESISIAPTPSTSTPIVGGPAAAAATLPGPYTIPVYGYGPYGYPPTVHPAPVSVPGAGPSMTALGAHSRTHSRTHLLGMAIPASGSVSNSRMHIPPSTSGSGSSSRTHIPPTRSGVYTRPRSSRHGSGASANSTSDSTSESDSDHDHGHNHRRDDGVIYTNMQTHTRSRSGGSLPMLGSVPMSMSRLAPSSQPNANASSNGGVYTSATSSLHHPSGTSSMQNLRSRSRIFSLGHDEDHQEDEEDHEDEDEEENIKMICTTPGGVCAGETETETDEPVSLFMLVPSFWF